MTETALHTSKNTNIIWIRVYVDGLNFYYNVAGKYGFKWIDIKGLFLYLLQQNIAPNVQIEKIFLFTAVIKGDAAEEGRQKAYLEAMKAHYGDCLVVVEGRMQTVEKKGKFLKITETKPASAKQGKRLLAAVLRRLVNSLVKISPLQVKIKTFGEKETDVNLACQIVDDAYTAVSQGTTTKQAFDAACLVSNDSDFARALMIKRQLKQRMILICPRVETGSKNISANLEMWTHKKDRVPHIPRDAVLRHRLPDPVGEWKKPEGDGWV